MSVFSNFSPIYLGVVAWHQKVKGQLQKELRRIEDKILFQRQCQFVSYLFDYGMISDPNDDVDVHLGDEDHHYIDVDVDVDHHHDVDLHLGDEGEPVLVHDRLHLLSLPDALRLPQELYSSPEPSLIQSGAPLCARTI